ncbi:XRN4 [Symbiodinium sp. CCMP2592]|nr:XRN4 [Symbiodinium sp. CCMP2592]
MGIPRLTQWLRSTFPDAFALEADLQAEHVYLDVNCILHEALGALGGSAPEDTFLRHVFQRLDLILAQCPGSEMCREARGREVRARGREVRARELEAARLDHLLPKLFAEQNEDQALRLGHLALISDEPDNAEKLAHNKRCKNVLDVCWQVIGSDILTSHDDSISILVNLLVPSATRSEVFRGLAEFAREKGSIEMLLKHVDMPALGHHLVKAVSRCGNVEERDVAQACSLTAASMENAEDRVAFCNFIISQDGGDSFMLKLFDAWPWQFGSLQLIETLDSFLISPVDNLMWDAQTANRREFAEKWLTFLIRQFLEPAAESTTSMHALGDTLQVKDSTFRQILLTQESLLEHLVSNLVVSLLTNRQDQARIRAAMYAALHVASSREPSALKHLANHARFDTLVALAVENMQLAMEEIGERKEHDIINVLTIFLQNEATKKAAAWLQHHHLAAKFVIGYRCHDGDVARVRRHVAGHGSIDKPLNKLAATFMDEAPAKQRSAEAAAPEKGQSKTQLTNYILKELTSGPSDTSY